jgi:Holliday junction resolvasome RuvABC ATP-dependent DNA helicase subunit
MRDFIGQALAIKELLGLWYDDSTDAVLLKGKYGHGKTTLAEWYAGLFGKYIYYDIPPRNFNVIPSTFGNIVIDEIHRIQCEEALYRLIAERRVVMCTTDTANLSGSLKSRCVIIQLQDYTLSEIIQIIRVNMDINLDKAKEIALRSNLNPRVAIMLTHRVRRLIKVDGLPFNLEAVLKQFDDLGIDRYGLDDRHRAYLALLSNIGRPASLRTIALTLQLSEDTVREEI